MVITISSPALVLPNARCAISARLLSSTTSCTMAQEPLASLGDGQAKRQSWYMEIDGTLAGAATREWPNQPATAPTTTDAIGITIRMMPREVSSMDFCSFVGVWDREPARFEGAMLKA